MKLYLVDDIEYVAAHSEEEAANFYKSLDSSIEGPEIEEVKKEDWPEYLEDYDHEKGEPSKVPFLPIMEEAEINGYPCVVASKEQ